MQVKKYQGKTINEVMAKVKAALGPDAMILHSHRLDGKDQGFEIAAMPAVCENPQAPSVHLSEMKADLMTIKEIISLLSCSSPILERLILNPPLLGLYGRMVKNGISDTHARIFLERAGVLNGDSCPAEEARKRAMKEILRVIDVHDPFEGNDNTCVIAAFIGTTGVGKTTTIAKLASNLMLKRRKTVGLISVDGYRIGAMEQLRAYANILGIPCFPAFNKRDLGFALQRLKNRDVILIDTAGQSHYDKARITELTHMMDCVKEIHCHLLLSVATSELEMSRIAAHFSPLGIGSYLFTKLDESEKHGSVLNQIMRQHLPISYLTTGQNVPADIEKGDKSRILGLLLSDN